MTDTPSHKLVPVTEEMIAAGQNWSRAEGYGVPSNDEARGIYRAMADAAPASPQLLPGEELVEALKQIMDECDEVGSPSNGAMDVARAVLQRLSSREKP